jgi:hypothetical protein
MKLAVLGAGLFGSTAALHLARAGHSVDLYEAKNAVMSGATAHSFNRLHRGAHYPRDVATGRESRAAEASFRAEYGDAVIDNGRQLYVVPEESLNHVTPDSFHAFLAAEKIVFYRSGNAFRVIEPRIDMAHLTRQVKAKLDVSAVTLHLGIAPDGKALRDHYDKIIVATYAGLNHTLADLDLPLTPYRYQVVERPLAFLHADFHGTSIVVLDGPYGCLDPLDDSTIHMLGHVTETIHAETTSIWPHVPHELAPLINNGMVPAHELQGLTCFPQVVESLSQWVANLDGAEHIGSTFVVRAVQAYVEETDARPTLVEQLDHQVIRVFSGKLGTACRAAAEVVNLIEAADARRDRLQHDHRPSHAFAAAGE